MSKVLNSIKSLVAVVAPTLATSFGGPLAGAATATISKMLLGKEDASESELVDFILAHQNPETLAKLKMANMEFEADMKRLEIDIERLDVEREKVAVDDRKSARDMQSMLGGKAAGFLALAIILMFGANIIALFRHDIPTESAPVLYTLTGALAAGLTQVLNFYFGSSNGSKAKDTSMADLSRSLAAMRLPLTGGKNG